MALKESDRKNFDTLVQAIKNGDAALVETKDSLLGGYVAVIVATRFSEGAVDMIPLAKMFGGNPFDELVPPVDAIDVIDAGPVRPTKVRRARRAPAEIQNARGIRITPAGEAALADWRTDNPKEDPR